MKLDLAHGYAAVPFALLIVACSPVVSGGASGSSGVAGSGGAGGSSGVVGSGGAGGMPEQCGPGALDCLCQGGYFECQNNMLACVCPPQCTSSAGCEAGSFCVFTDGYCGRDAPGYCQSIAKAQEWDCGSGEPTCACDGKLYDSYCAAVLAGASPNHAPTTDCSAPPLPCSDTPSAVSCYPSDYCMVWGQDESCVELGPCAVPSCDCLSYNPMTCTCEVRPSGLVKLTCSI